MVFKQISKIYRVNCSKFSSSKENLVFDRYFASPGHYTAPKKSNRDVIIVGGGHNGLVAAAYLGKLGLDVVVLERRDRVGGAAVTEEVFPGFKFSRASYLAGLMRPNIIEDLNLRKYGFKYISRDPSSFTPTLFSSKYGGKYLILGNNANENHKSISQFSTQDADAFTNYEEFLDNIREIIQPIVDSSPPDITEGGFKEKLKTLGSIGKLLKVGYKHQQILLPFYELMVGPASVILDRFIVIYTNLYCCYFIVSFNIL
jgi:phytoene dehydrogenase-like protein